MTRDAVTGAFGFSGRHIAARLLERGREVVTLTNHPDRPDPFGGRVHVRPLAFDDAASLADGLRGVDTLYNTYWMRLERRGVTFADAVRNSKALFRAAGSAGVRRIVHVSIANADRAPHLPYYRGKAQVEDALKATGIGHAILRPAVLMGDEPMLINSIAWMLRHLPAFGIPGDGRYRIQPIHVDDLAQLATELADADGDVAIDAAGPEQFTFDEFLKRICTAVGSRALLIRVPPVAALLAGRGLGLLLRDVVITREELIGLTENLLMSAEPPRGTTRFTDWLAGAAPWLGRRYASELRRHFG
ncbi:MAG: SDR family oxidoreductase [Candidatus Limnocylindria bacterium]